jgi:hypothetical protein
MTDDSRQSPVNTGDDADHCPKVRTSKNLSHSRRESVYLTLVSMLENGNLPHGAKERVAKMYGTSSQTVGRIWSRGRESLQKSATGDVDVRSRKFLTGRKSAFKEDVLRERIMALPQESRRTTRVTAAALGISQTHFLYLMKKYDNFRTEGSSTATKTNPQLIKKENNDQQNISPDSDSDDDPETTYY